jgi:hypothetical protein
MYTLVTMNSIHYAGAQTQKAERGIIRAPIYQNTVSRGKPHKSKDARNTSHKRSAILK